MSPFDQRIDPSSVTSTLSDLSLVMNLHEAFTASDEDVIDSDHDDEHAADSNRDDVRYVRRFIANVSSRFPRLRILRINVDGEGCPMFADVLSHALASPTPTAQGTMRLQELHIWAANLSCSEAYISEVVKRKNPSILKFGMRTRI